MSIVHVLWCIGDLQKVCLPIFTHFDPLPSPCLSKFVFGKPPPLENVRFYHDPPKEKKKKKGRIMIYGKNTERTNMLLKDSHCIPKHEQRSENFILMFK